MKSIVTAGRTASWNGCDAARPACATTGPGAPARARIRKPPPGPVVPCPSVRPPAVSVTAEDAAGVSEPVKTTIRP